MNSPVLKTLIIAIIAAITTVTAAYFYPWPEHVVQSESLGQPLFETYGAGAVRSIRIEQFNIDRNTMDRIQLDRQGEKWVIPGRKDFVANNSFQISLATRSLDEKTILEERTDQVQDHLKYGVVDPVDFASTPNRSALGTKIILEGRGRTSLASLIIGKRVGAAGGLGANPMEPGKFFVRIPGQPSVYVIDFDPRALQTDFQNWVDANLFQFSDLIPVNRFKVEDYRLDPTTLDPGSRLDNYRAVFSAGRLPFVEVKQNANWKPVELTAEINEHLQVLGQQMHMIVLMDVVRKKAELAKLFKAPVPNVTDEDFDSLKPYGFRITGFGNSTYDFDSAGGEMVIEFGDGVSISLYIGSIAEKSSTPGMGIGYYVMMSAGVNEAVYPVPPKPLKIDDPAEAESQNKAYLRRVEDRKEGIRSARQRATELNQGYGDWIYIVSEDVIERLRPDLALNVDSTPVTPAIIPEVEKTSGSKEQAKGESGKVGKPDGGSSGEKTAGAGETKPGEVKPGEVKPGEEKPDESESAKPKPKPKPPANDPFGGGVLS